MVLAWCTVCRALVIGGHPDALPPPPMAVAVLVVAAAAAGKGDAAIDSTWQMKVSRLSVLPGGSFSEAFSTFALDTWLMGQAQQQHGIE